MAGWFRCYWGSKPDWKQSSEIQARSFKVTIQPRFKKWYPFFCYLSLPQGVTMFHSDMRFYVMQSLATRFYGSLSVYSQPLPSQKNCLSAILVYTTVQDMGIAAFSHVQIVCNMVDLHAKNTHVKFYMNNYMPLKFHTSCVYFFNGRSKRIRCWSITVFSHLNFSRN